MSPLPGLRGSTAQRVSLLGAISVVAGLLMAGMLLPIVGGVGLLARSGADDFENYPSELKISPPPQVSRILAADGSTLATFFFQDRVPVSIDEVPQVMKSALIAVEDVRFYEHHGVDWRGALRALLHNGSSGEVQQGGSTLTQQYVKNVLIETAEQNGDAKAAEAAHADTLARKVQEAKYALELERRYTKAQILEGYLNIAYFGDGAYGVGTAAEHYFGKKVQHLTLPQAAMLAGLVQSPEAYDPVLHPAAARQRRFTVLSQMLKYHFIDRAQFDSATAAPIALHVHTQGNGCEASSAPYFCDYVQHVIENSSTFGPNRAARLRLLNNGGLTIRTTLRPKVQRAADHAVRNYVHPRDPSHVAAAEAVLQPGTGKVLAISVNRPYGQNAKKGQNTIDYAVDQKYGGGIAGYPAGSTFKLFVLAAALKQGIPLNTTIFAPRTLYNYPGYTDCRGDELTYSPKISNAGESEAGKYNLINGTWDSVNTFYAQLEKRTGLCAPVKIAESMGVREENGAPPEQVPSFVLGAAGAGYSVMDLAGAYATIAAHGLYCSPEAITSITGQGGKRYAVPQQHCAQVLPPGLADTITSILHGVLTEPGATAAQVGEPGRPAAAKTGTADNNVASDFAGFVPQMAAAVWVGDPKAPTTRSLSFTTIGGRYYTDVFGATIAGPIWRDTLEAALKGVPVEQLPPPDAEFVHGILEPVPDVTGLEPDAAGKMLENAGFTVQVAVKPIDSLFPKGTVAKTVPSSSTGAPPGATITMYLSNGHPPPPKHKPSQSPSPSTTPSTTPSSGPPPPSHTPGPPPPTPSCPPKKHGHKKPGC
jgi:membrane peptidoglycan carboxypeptidase